MLTSVDEQNERVEKWADVERLDEWDDVEWVDERVDGEVDEQDKTIKRTSSRQTDWSKCVQWKTECFVAHWT